jgi:hypothetical protein
MGMKIADDIHNFEACLHFSTSKLSFPSGILPTLSALHAISGFRMQFAPQGTVFDYLLQQLLRESVTLLQAAGRYSTTACNTL